MFCKSTQTQGKISVYCHQLRWFQNLLDHLWNKFWINVPKSSSYFVNEELLVFIKKNPSVCFSARYDCVYIYICSTAIRYINPTFFYFCYIKAEVDFFFSLPVIQQAPHSEGSFSPHLLSYVSTPPIIRFSPRSLLKYRSFDSWPSCFGLVLAAECSAGDLHVSIMRT